MQCIAGIHRQGRKETAEWLSVWMADEARDRELEEEWQPARLAPADSQVAADLRSNPYVQLLLWLGMTPPALRCISSLEHSEL